MAENTTRGYVSCGGTEPGIYTCEFDPARGRAEIGRRASEDRDIAFLAAGPDARCLYAATSDEGIPPDTAAPRGLARAYRIDPATGGLTRINEQRTQGSSPCYLAVAGGGRALLVANFREFGRYGNAGHRSRGSLCVLPIRPDGSLGPASDVRVHEGHSVHPDRQTASHPHGIHLHPGGRWLAVCDLGTDQLYAYELDPAGLRVQPAPAPHVPLPRPTGPRHLAFHPSGRFACVVSETRTALIALSFDDATGRMEILEETPVLAGGETEGASGADIQAHPSGQFLYASIRGRAGIAICRMDGARGSLEAAGFVPLPGGALDELRIVPGGEFLLAPTDKGILSYRIATGTGALARSGGSRGIPSGAIALLGARQSGSGQEGEAK